MINRSFNLDFFRSGVVCKTLSETHKNFKAISTDTREELSGCLFWALVGDAHDAHAFVGQAVEKGAAGIVVHKITPEISALADKATVIVVPDTLVALQDFGRFVRRSYHVPVVGITGSNGKTSTKEFAAGIIAPHRKIHWSVGSFNNHWGVPISILSAPADADSLLLEMGMNHSGEITELCEIAEPTVVICTLVGKTHMGHFKSVDEIASAKEEIYQHARPDAIRIYNLDNAWTAAMEARSQKEYPRAQRIFRYSGDTKNSSKVDVHLKVMEQSAQGLKVSGRIGDLSGEAVLPVIGAHHVANAMAAASIALALDLSPSQIWSTLHLCRGAWGRMQLLSTQVGVSVLFDGYNASPDSYRALFEAIPSWVKVGEEKRGQRKIVGVFAEMRELGESASDEHFNIGVLAGKIPFDEVWFFGPSEDSFKRGIKSAAFQGELITSLEFDVSIGMKIAKSLNAGDLVAVKGSRGLQTERFVKLLNPIDFKAK